MSPSETRECDDEMSEQSHGPFLEALDEEGFPAERVQLPGDKDYESNRKTHFNLDVVCHPMLFACPTTTAEVSAAVRAYAKALPIWKKQNDTIKAPGLCICGGRHSTRSLREGSFILDLSLLDSVDVDLDAQTVTVGGGVKIGAMVDALAPFHLAVVTGTHIDTGVVGLTLGGGQGFLSKKFGPAVDQIVSAEIVLADGSVRTVRNDEEADRDILFNIRGAGGNIGVVTKLKMKAYPVRNIGMLESLNLVFTQSGVEDIMNKYGEWSLSSPDDCTSFIVLPLRMPIVVVMGVSCDTNSIPQSVDESVATATVKVSNVPGLAELNSSRLGAWFRLKSGFSVKDYCRSAMQEFSKEQSGHYYYTNMFIPEITPKISAIFAEAQRGYVAKGVKGAVLLFNHAGTVTENIPTTETAFEIRKMKYWLLCQCSWDVTGNKERDDEARERTAQFNRWFRHKLLEAGARRTVHPVANMEQDYEQAEQGHFFQDVNRERILRTQNALDPNGIFMMNRTVN